MPVDVPGATAGLARGVPAAKKFSAGGVAVGQGDGVSAGAAQGRVMGAVYIAVVEIQCTFLYGRHQVQRAV